MGRGAGGRKAEAVVWGGKRNAWMSDEIGRQRWCGNVVGMHVLRARGASCASVPSGWTTNAQGPPRARSCNDKRPSMLLVHIRVCKVPRAQPPRGGLEQLLAYGPALPSPSLPSLRPPLLVLALLDLPRVIEAAATAKANAVFIFLRVGAVSKGAV
jgi:hypothetical protein